MISPDRKALSIHLAASPEDWPARLILSDILEDAQDESGAHLERSHAWKWAWAEAQYGRELLFVDGRGTGPKQAAFGGGKGEGVLWLWWCADRYDCPGDNDNQRTEQEATAGRVAWLASSPECAEEGLPLVWHGCPLVEFCRAVEIAGGWWLPDGERTAA